MAKNKIFPDARQLSLVCTAPAVPVSGDPVLVGQIPGVALTDERTDGTTSVDMQGVFDLSVQGVDAVPANVAVAVGDIVYYDAASPGAKLNRDATNGVRFGYALEAVASGATDTIRVKVGY